LEKEEEKGYGLEKDVEKGVEVKLSDDETSGKYDVEIDIGGKSEQKETDSYKSRDENFEYETPKPRNRGAERAGDQENEYKKPEPRKRDADRDLTGYDQEYEYKKPEPRSRDRDHTDYDVDTSYSSKRDDTYVRKPKEKDTFEYDTYVDMVGEGASFATAAQLSALEKRHQVLIDAIDKLEDRLFETEEKKLAVQRELLIAGEVSADYRTLIDQRESQNVLLRKEIDQLGVKYQNEVSRFNEIDNERRKLEHKAALVQAEKDVNARAQSKLEQYLAEIENLKQKLASMLTEKGELDQQVNQRQREVSELEKKLHSESSRSREINNRTISNLEHQIESERKRAQQAIDYVRQTLKAKIRVLEAQVETDRASDTNIKNEKRDISRQLKNVIRKLDDQKSEVGRVKRKHEALVKQVAAVTDKQRILKLEIADLENEHHALQRETSTLATQVQVTQLTNLTSTAITTEIAIVEQNKEE
jgi:predicted nuclease with TOPRIM domain